MLGFNGGLIGVRRDPSLAGAAGLWLPNEVSIARRVNRWPTLDDPFFSDISGLFPFDGIEDQTSFPDGGPNDVIAARSGNARLRTAQSRWGATSLRVAGGSDWVDIPGSALLTFPGDFTVEAWVWMDVANSGLQNVIEIGQYTDGVLIRSSGGSGDVWINGSNMGNISSFFTSTNWHFVHVSRQSGVCRVSVDGVVRLIATIGGTANSGGAAARVGVPRHTSGQNLIGYVSDLRITKGVARSNAVPEAPFTRRRIVSSDPFITSTSLLLSMNGANGSIAFPDTGVRTLAVAALGAAQVSTAQSKYGGASGLFNGTDAYLRLAPSESLNFGTGDFTLETWARFNSIGGDWFLMSAAGSGGLFFGYRNSGSPSFGIGRAGIAWDGTVSWTPSTGVWYHLAAVRKNFELRFFVDGAQVGATLTSTFAYNISTTNLTIGSQGAALYLSGNLDDLRITRGIARYWGTFTPPGALAGL